MELLRDRFDLIKMLLDNTPIAYVILDRKYRIHYANKSFALLKNLDLTSSIGDKCYNLSNEGVICSGCSVQESIHTKKKTIVSRKEILPNGEVRFLDEYSIPLQFDKDGNVEYILDILIDRTNEKLAREQRNKDYDEILSTFSTLLEAKDNYTACHSDNVRVISLNLARALRLSLEEIFEISVAASLHDIGKVEIPDSIINKAGKLTDDEFNTIKSHPVHSSDMLKGLTSFDRIQHMSRHHHERVDGKGYPDGLKGDEISIGAKIIAIADTYDAITTTRSYRKALSHEYALTEIKRVAGTQLDEKLVDIFINLDFDDMVDSFDEISNKNKTKINRIITTTDEPHDDSDDFTPLKDIDLNYLFGEILKSTPCGYVLMDRHHKIYYANDYFLNYLGLPREKTINYTCYEAGGVSRTPCPICSIRLCLKSGKTEFLRKDLPVASTRKIFDSYGLPLINENGEIEYVTEIIIDRAEETLAEEERERDFKKIMDLLNTILEKEKEHIDDENLSAPILKLQKRLQGLLESK